MRWLMRWPYRQLICVMIGWRVAMLISRLIAQSRAKSITQVAEVTNKTTRLVVRLACPELAEGSILTQASAMSAVGKPTKHPDRHARPV